MSSHLTNSLEGKEVERLLKNKERSTMQNEASDVFDRSKDSLLQLKEVRRRTGLSTATIYRREAAGTFPPRIRLSERCVRWYESDIGRFVANPADFATRL
jgi:prophage regulatory protein